jgi:hypothetical protein
MKKEISPAIMAVSVVVVVLVAAALIWTGTQKHDQLPDKPPSGPITLPPSQQGRRMPGGNFSGALPGTPGNGR